MPFRIEGKPMYEATLEIDKHPSTGEFLTLLVNRKPIITIYENGDAYFGRKKIGNWKDEMTKLTDW